jgi:hypothetical protein
MWVLKWISLPKMLPGDGPYMLRRESTVGEQSSAQRASVGVAPPMMNGTGKRARHERCTGMHAGVVLANNEQDRNS